jgi:serine/threonine protein kinase
MSQSATPERDPLQPLADEFLDRLRRGEQPKIAEYRERCPELAGRIDELFPALLEIEQFGSVVSNGARGQRPHPPIAEIPERLGDYRILRELGRGGMGIVYEAEQESLARRVALKVLPRHAYMQPEQLARFRRESRAVARLHHTNIVPVYGVGEHEGLHYYAMQLISGQGLDSILDELIRLRSNGSATLAPDTLASFILGTTKDAAPGTVASSTEETAAATRIGASATVEVEQAHGHSSLSASGESGYFREVARIGLQVAEALSHAHSQSVLHRDIKPSNLMLDVAGTTWVTDFGLAKSDDAEALTRTGDVVGTLRYMAPERFDGKSNALSDIYALGATLYELLALRPAFVEAERPKLIAKIAHDDPVALRKVDRRIPRDLETIVGKAMAKEPAARYATAAAMAEDLRRFLSGRTILARQARPWERLAMWSRRRPLVAGLTAAVALVGAIGFATTYWKWRDAEHRGELLATAIHKADDERNAAVVAQQKAEKESANAKAVVRFLTDDLLVQADPRRNPRSQAITMEQAVDRAAERAGSAFGDKPEVEAAVRRTIGIVYMELERFSDAERHFRAALKALAQVRPADWATIGDVRTRLAHVLGNLGRAAEGEVLLRRTIDELSRELGPEHPVALLARDNHSTLLSPLKRLEEAERAARDILDVRQRVNGPSDPTTLLAKARLFTVLGDRKKLAEAESLGRELVVVLQRVEGENHPHALLMEANFARLLRNQKRRAEAEPFYRHVMDGRRLTLGRDHPSTVQTAAELAELYHDLLRPSESLQLAQENLEVGRDVRPQPKDAIALLQRIIAEDLGHLARWRESADAYARTREVLENNTEALQHRFVAMLMAGQIDSRAQLLAAALQRFRDAPKAPSAYDLARASVITPDLPADVRELVDMAEFGVRAAPRTPWRLYVAGLAHYRAGDFTRAISRLEESLKVDPQWNTGLNWPVLAMAHHGLKHDEEAKAWLDRAGEWRTSLTRKRPDQCPLNCWWDWTEFLLLEREARALVDAR